MRLENAAALVTGAARRVGRAIALELARSGADIAVHYRQSRAEADVLAAEIAVLGRTAVLIQGDLADTASWPRIIDETVGGLGRLDVLVNNASAFLTDQPDTIESFDADRWTMMWRVNMLAPAGLCHHARPHLVRSGAGKIVNLCDIAAERPWPSHLAYSVSKAGLVALTRGLARALAPDVQVNGVSPGIAVFPESYDQETREKLTDRVPLQRAGTPEEVAALVRFIIESGDYMTGQIVPIDGGRSIV